MEGVRTVQHERLTIQEAAHRLGVSESAVRKRIKRGTLKREKTEDGRVLVYMGPSVPGTEEVRTPERDALISEMQQRLAHLERELDVRTEEIRRRDTIIMNMTEAMKALSPPSQEASPEARESPQTVEEEPKRAEPRPATGEAQEDAEHPHQRSSWLAPVDRLPWWQYVAGLVMLFLLACGLFSPELGSWLEMPQSLALLLVLIVLGFPSYFGCWVGFRQKTFVCGVQSE
jgi:excisionase family DNA binding protein